MRNYTTTQGDMWDIISLNVYGDEKLMHLLIEANPKYRNVAVFSANCNIAVPDMPSRRENDIPLAWRGNT